MNQELKQKLARFSLSIIVCAGILQQLISSSSSALAAQPPGVTTVPYTVSYSARLTNASGVAVTTPQDVRFSLWTDADYDPTDILPSGAINPAAVGFTGWSEVHSVTPDANGLFQVRLGTITTLPNFSVNTDTFLQVEVEPTGSPLTSFEVLDPDSNTANTTDRFPMDSSAFAINSDTLDNHDACNTVGTCAPGQIPFLDGTGLLPINTIPGGTNGDTFILDNDNNAPGNIKLQFGNTLNKFLEYNPTAGYFNFNDDVNIQGDLTVTGTINGVTISPLTVTGTYDQTINYDPEYKGGVIQPDDANVGGNEGTVKDLFSAADKMNYYHWTTNQATTQDIFITIRSNVPEGFNVWQSTPIKFTYRTGTASAADNSLDVSMTDTAGNPVTLSTATGLTSPTFTTTNINFTGAPTFTPGQPFTITVKMNATSAGSADAGRLQLNYNGR